MNAEVSEVFEWDWVYGEADDVARLHYLVEHDWPDDDYVPSGPGTTPCGLSGEWSIPGIFSRMGVERCPVCCDALGYPWGVGSPKNDDTCRPLVEARLPRTLHEGAGL